MQFKGLTLDDFQVESIQHIENNHSVVVSAATGTGKTSLELGYMRPWEDVPPIEIFSVQVVVQ